ncbi:arylsulfatase B [Tundrisphaera sp. TA3]|uniref:arylsulfatase B n=1 Tax=Tundrisphaera sp. TA3 TaxID=3435775 RepID=UPI003EBE9F68
MIRPPASRSFARALLAAVAWLPAAVAAGADRPNILLIVADDLGWADVAYHGGRVATPNIDRLAKTGVELDAHYVQPVCTPTRTALMTGRYPGRFGPQALAPSNLRALPPGTETLASALRSVGYTTHMAGKWHLGSRQEWGPKQYGFDHSYGSLNGAVDPWGHLYRKGPYARTWHRDGVVYDEEGNATELVARQSAKWIREAKGPWLVYVPFHAVHIPVDAPDEYKKLHEGRKFYDDPKMDESYHRFAAFISQLDAKVGELVAAVDASGARDNTLIVFTSDNGGLHSGANAYISQVPPTPVLSSNLPLRGQKDLLYEGGIRVPACVNWPAKLAPRKLLAPLHAVDWMPTLAKLVGYQSASDLKWDGLDAWPLLSGAAADPAPRTLYIAHRRGHVLRHGDWKLIAFANGRSELYNIAADPYETADRAAAEPAKLAELKALLDGMRAKDVDKLPADLEGIPA